MTSLSPHEAPQRKTEFAGIDPAVIELLASRICHDLISPVGAVHNGVEFLQESGDSGGEAVDLIAHSAEMAAARLQVFRLAYGAGGRDTNIKPEDVYKTFDSSIRLDGKVTQGWNPKGKLGFQSIPLGYCKILMGCLMLAQECLPKGGKISVEAGAPDHTHIVAEGQDAALRQNVREALARALDVQTLDPRLVHPYVLSVLANHYGLSVGVAGEEKGRVVFDLGFFP